MDRITPDRAWALHDIAASRALEAQAVLAQLPHRQKHPSDLLGLRLGELAAENSLEIPDILTQHIGIDHQNQAFVADPAEFRGLKVPEILTSGNTPAIEQWRAEQALARTRARRPDLLGE